ncbi:MAG: hypothetical protein WEB58_17635 [Planctomycetaceae bacterium]
MKTGIGFEPVAEFLAAPEWRAQAPLFFGYPHIVRREQLHHAFRLLGICMQSASLYCEMKYNFSIKSYDRQNRLNSCVATFDSELFAATIATNLFEPEKRSRFFAHHKFSDIFGLQQSVAFIAVTRSLLADNQPQVGCGLRPQERKTVGIPETTLAKENPGNGR